MSYYSVIEEGIVNELVPARTLPPSTSSKIRQPQALSLFDKSSMFQELILEIDPSWECLADQFFLPAFEDIFETSIVDIHSPQIISSASFFNWSG